MTIYKENYLKELYSYAGKDKVEQHGDQHNVSNCFNGHKHTLDNMLWKREQR